MRNSITQKLAMSNYSTTNIHVDPLKRVIHLIFNVTSKHKHTHTQRLQYHIDIFDPKLKSLDKS